MSMWLRVVPASLVVAASVPAQPARVVDEGSVTFTRAGAPFGTESFKISRRLGANGVEYVAQSTRTLEGRIMRVSLTSDSTGDPTTYTRSVNGPASSQLTARRALNRLTVNEDGPQASSRDYIFAAGSRIVEDDVFCPFFFVTWREAPEMGFVDLTGRAAGRASVVELGRESVTIGNASISATRYAFGTGDARREIWLDSERRLLKISHPARQVVGIRDLPPR